MARDITVRPATATDHGALRAAIIDLQEYERALHDSRRPGITIADAYVIDLEQRIAERQGLIVIAEASGRFAGYSAGWVQQDDTLAQTPDANRYGYVFDCYVIPAKRGPRTIASTGCVHSRARAGTQSLGGSQPGEFRTSI